MFKIAGVILCVLGSAGYGFVKISCWKQGLEEMKTWILLLQKIKSCIIYQKETLEGCCIWVGEKEGSKQGTILKQIGCRARMERDNEFVGIWHEEMGKWCKKTALPKRTAMLLLRFPEYIKEVDEQLQLSLFSVYMEELQREELEMEQQIKEQQKPVMAISLVVGMMLSILLV